VGTNFINRQLMKVVKLNRTHNLHRWGYTHAIRFEYRTRDVNELIDTLRSRFGQDTEKWYVYRARKDRPLWIGFKDAKIISFVLML
jgi:hypothetical protein